MGVPVCRWESRFYSLVCPRSHKGVQSTGCGSTEDVLRDLGQLLGFCVPQFLLLSLEMAIASSQVDMKSELTNSVHCLVQRVGSIAHLLLLWSSL